MPNVPNTVELVSGMPIYDTYTAAAAATVPAEVKMMVDPISGTKGLNRTNLTEPGRLSAPKSFLVQAIRVVFGVKTDELDLIAFLQDYVLRLFVGDNEFAVAGLEYFPAGAGVVSAVATNDATVTKYARFNNGIQDPRAICSLDKPVPIGIGESFRVELKGTSFNTTAAVWMRVYLDGILSRGR